MRNQRGAVVIIVALCVVGLLGMAALAIDLGYMYVTRNELQNISDSASLAATRYLGHIYEGIPFPEQSSHVFSGAELAAIKNAAVEMGAANIAAGKYITINDDDIHIGRWHFDTRTFEETTGTMLTAVKVVARRDDIANFPVRTFFANVLGIGNVNVNTLAVASLSSQSQVEPGNLIPVGISEQWFTQDFCGQPIKFYPTDESSCAGWNVFFGTQISEAGGSCPGGVMNDACLRKRILEEWLASVQANPTDPSYKTPGAQIGDFFEFGGGNLANAIEAFSNLFNVMKTIDEDGNPDTWSAQVVVYKSPDCSNPNGSIEIVGFASVTITHVWAPTDPANPYFGSNKWCIEGQVICDKIEPSRGGGGEYGTYGSIPNLVQ